MRSPNRCHDAPFLYKYASAATATAILWTRTLRWSSPLLFNDPFDVPREWDGFNYCELENAFVARFATYLEGAARPRSPAALNLLDGFLAQARDPKSARFFDAMRLFLRLQRPRIEQHIEEMRVAWRDKLPGMRILCFSADPLCVPMWAHYTENHTGAVLQFESNDERDSAWLLARPVIYQAAKPSLPSAAEWARAFMGEIELDWDRFLAEYHLVKHLDWSYEREYRVASGRKPSETGHFGDYVFHREDLRGVILGVRMSPQDESLIRSIVAANYPAAVVSCAQVDYSARSIHVAT